MGVVTWLDVRYRKCILCFAVVCDAFQPPARGLLRGFGDK